MATQKIIVTKSHTTTIKEMAKILNITQKQASQIKQKIENKINAPKYMVWGVPTRYNIATFATEAGIKVQFKKTKEKKSKRILSYEAKKRHYKKILATKGKAAAAKYWKTVSV